jgi:uncharacterized protein (TIGR00369 family)
MSANGNRDDYMLLPAGESHNCFGCSPKNEAGLHMEFYLNEKLDTVVSWLWVPGHLCGWGNIVHGGIISTMLDEAMGWAALVLLRKLVLSKSISVEFFKPVFTGKEIRAEGSVLEVANDREAVMQGCIYDGDDLCARSNSTYSLFTIEYIRKLGVVDETMLNELDMLMSKYDKETLTTPTKEIEIKGG